VIKPSHIGALISSRQKLVVQRVVDIIKIFLNDGLRESLTLKKGLKEGHMPR